MASYRKRQGKWQAQVRLAGKPAISKTFPTKELARAWAAKQETILLSEGVLPDKEQANTKLNALFERYLHEVTPRKKGSIAESYRLNALSKSILAGITVGNLKPSDIAKYRDRRLDEVSDSTVRRELVLIRHCMAIASHEWGFLQLSDIFASVTLPKEAPHRIRRISPKELEALLSALNAQRNKQYRLIVEFALETGMRRSEILNLEWRDILSEYVVIKDSKSGHSRSIPLSKKARSLMVDKLFKHSNTRIFNVTPNSVRLAWERACTKAGITDLRFHDLRHEAISRFLEKGLGIAEVATISGHRDYKTLQKYAHIETRRILAKLN
jgi:integrase